MQQGSTNIEENKSAPFRQPGVCCPIHRQYFVENDTPSITQLLKNRKDERTWVVLVSGEHYGVTTGRGTMGQHCSLVHVGEAYAKLVDHVGRENIIVIAQLQETLDWLQKASDTGIAPLTGSLFTKGQSIEESKSAWAAKLRSTRQRCARLIADGGADYDFADVNPDTVLRVLRGEEPILRGAVKVKKHSPEQANAWEAATDSVREAAKAAGGDDDDVAEAASVCIQRLLVEEAEEDKGQGYGQPIPWDPWLYRGGSGRVVPCAGGRSVVLGIYSHGWSHTASGATRYMKYLSKKNKCDLCQLPHMEGVKYVIFSSIFMWTSVLSFVHAREGVNIAFTIACPFSLSFPPTQYVYVYINIDIYRYDHDHSSLSTREWFFNMVGAIIRRTRLQPKLLGDFS
jgi:hypothetical protein